MKENLSNMPVEEISDRQISFYVKWLSEHKELGSERKYTAATFDEVFRNRSVLAISGLRLPPATGFRGHLGLKQTVEILKENLTKLRNTGINGVILESYLDKPHKIFYDDKKLLDYYLNLATIAKKESKGKFKVGINLILFDVYGALAIAKSAGLDFVAVDEFVNPVECSKEEANFDYSFIFDPKPTSVRDFQRDINAENILVLAGSHSNYYPLVKTFDFESSVQKAVTNSAAAVVLGKDNAHLYNSNGKFTVPVLISGGIKYEDIDWIKKDKFRGFLAGSLFEEKFGVIDPKKVESVLEMVK